MYGGGFPGRRDDVTRSQCQDGSGRGVEITRVLGGCGCKTSSPSLLVALLAGALLRGKPAKGGIDLQLTILAFTARLPSDLAFAGHIAPGQRPRSSTRNHDQDRRESGHRKRPCATESSCYYLQLSRPRSAPRRGPLLGSLLPETELPSPALEVRYCVTIIAGVMKDRARVG